MNDPSVLNQNQLNIDASLNTLLYLHDYYDGTPDGTPVPALVKIIERNVERRISQLEAEGMTRADAEKEMGDIIRQKNIVVNSLDSVPGFKDLVIANQTSQMNDPATGDPYEHGGIIACTFQDDINHPTKVVVTYCGTYIGEWYDNGLGLAGDATETAQQVQAREYFDFIVEDNNWDHSYPYIHITGHSKGGNKTQYVIMTSEYSDLVAEGYSLDGQCMSPEAIDHMIQILGEEEYNKRRYKLFAIAADNDYVNILGANNEDGRIIPAEHIFFLESNLSLHKWHYSDCFMNEDGTLTAFTEQGEVSKLLQGISQQVMELPPPIRGIITRGAMGIAEHLLGNGKPVNKEQMSFEDILGMVPLLFLTIPGGIIETIQNEYGVNLDWVSDVLTSALVVFYSPVILSWQTAGKVVDFVIAAANRIREFGKKCKEVADRIADFIENAVNKIVNWYNKNLNKGFIYASNNPSIKVDTYKLTAYADRLGVVNSRISKLDERLDSLYWKVGLLGLWNLIQADALTGYSFRLRRCQNYLNNTAEDFENVENDLSSRL